jgi:putative colanic acid biosynthesis acetyltransferase WcaF
MSTPDNLPTAVGKFDADNSVMQKPCLGQYDNGSFQRGRVGLLEALWVAVQAVTVSCWIPGSAHRRWLLRLFGARIGRGVVIKPGVRVKFPWRLSIGNDTWIGEDVWIDNLAEVTIGSDACISQGSYLCTGSHDWTSSNFGLIVKPVSVGDGAWIAARSVIGPGVTVGECAVLSLGSTATKDLHAWSIYSGNPAQFRKRRSHGISGPSKDCPGC